MLSSSMKNVIEKKCVLTGINLHQNNS